MKTVLAALTSVNTSMVLLLINYTSTSRAITREELQLVHTEEYLKKVERYNSSNFNILQSEGIITYVCDDTYKASIWSAGAGLSLTEAVLSDQVCFILT